MEKWFFLAFAVAFLIKVPLFPFHTWLPDAHVEAPTAGSIILAGVMLKMGTYGLLRFAFPLFPSAAMYFAPWIAGFAIVGIIYGALVAMVQPDLKKLVAYSSVSHLGFVVLGICAINVQGVQGAVYQMLNHGVSTGGLFMIVGMLSDRRHTRLISEFGGLKAVMPRLVAAFLLITLSSIALPGMNGFVGEFLILVGAFLWSPKFAAARRLRRHPVGGLHAVDVPARELRRDHEREEPRAAGPHAARVGADGADDRDGDRDGRVPERLPAADGAVGQAHDRARQRAELRREPGRPHPVPDRAAPDGARTSLHRSRSRDVLDSDPASRPESRTPSPEQP